MSSRREKLLQQLHPNLLKMTPKLSGVSGSVIDLESDEKSLEEGAKKLMMRFIKNQDLSEKYKRNQSQNDIEVTISSVKYNDDKEICELVSERLTFPFSKDDVELDSEKPGRKLQKLKMELQDKMSAKWEEEYKKRVKESKAFKEKSGKHKKKGFEEESHESEEESDSNEKSLQVEDEDEEEVCEKLNEDESDGDAADDEDEDEDEDEDDKDFNDDTASVNIGDVEVDESASFSNNEGNDDDNAVDDFGADACSLVPPYQPGGGLLYGGSELTQSEEGLPQNLLSPSLKLSMSGSPVSKFQSFKDSITNSRDLNIRKTTDNVQVEKRSFFQNCQNANDSFDLSDAFEFCSGKFPDAEERFKSPSVTQNFVPSHTDDLLEKAQNEGDEKEEEEELEENKEEMGEEEDEEEEEKEEDEEEEEEEEDEKGETNSVDKASECKQSLSKQRKNIIMLEDSETEDNCDKVEEIAESYSPPGKILSGDEDETPAGEEPASFKTRKKKRRILHFSDEEDETNNCEDDNSSELEEDAKGGGEDIDQRSIHYDSEENEIINPKEFFEGEAELSGSEWSGDEDERGLDVLDREDGDADELDNDQVRSQLEKIHIRRVLDDDAREVRLIQEILFEDGDLHSDGKRRDRKFKWKNLGTFDEKENEGETKENAGNSSDEDCAQEEELRKLRHQKELFLMEMKKNVDLSSDEEVVEDNFQMLKVTSVKSSFKLSVTNEKIIDCNLIAVNNEPKKPLSLCNARGSFLTRNEEFLSKLAKASSGITDNVMGPKNSKNFVFASKSPEKVNPDKNPSCKRQAEESKNCGRKEKKMKLLPKEIDTGPSILDLLY